MISEILKDNSLVLKHNRKIIYSSKLSGLRPLFYGIVEQRSIKSRECILYDKIIGLAAARLIVHSNIIKSVYTPTASKKAVDLLRTVGIEIIATNVADKILNKDKTGECPMEARALKAKNNSEFFLEIKKIFMP